MVNKHIHTKFHLSSINHLEGKSRMDDGQTDVYDETISVQRRVLRNP